MSKTNNVSDYIKKKKRGQWIRKASFLAMLCLLLFGVLYLAEQFPGSELNALITGNSQGNEEKFPLTIKNEQLIDAVELNGRLALLSKSNLLCYNVKGKRQSNSMHGYTNPVMKSNGKRVLIYDRAGNKLKVAASNSIIGELTLENSILCAAIASDGSIAVATIQDQYASYQIRVYDDLLNERYKFSPANEGATTVDFSSLAFSKDGSKLAACSITTKDGMLAASVYELDLNQDSAPIITLIPNLLPLDISWKQNGNLMLIGSDALVSLDHKTQQQVRYSYVGSLQGIVADLHQNTILVTRDLTENRSTITVIDAYGKVQESVSIEDTFLDITANEHRISVLGKKSVYHYDKSLLLLNQVSLERSFHYLTLIGNNLFLLTSDRVEKIRVD